MNRKTSTFVSIVVLLTLGGTAWAQEARPYIGIRLDPTGLPDLLTKHLGLEPEQGIRIKNVNVGSPADKAGIERDDIVVRFQGNDVFGLERFIKAVQQANIGDEVELEIIHLGKRRALKFSLESYEGQLQWKFPPEPEAVTTWRPGKFFHMGPEGDDWTEIPFDKIPEIDVDVKKFFEERYTFQHSTDGEDYTITIEGDPKDENTRVIVRADKTEYSTLIGELNVLPEKYRKAAQEAIDGARRSSRERIRISRHHFTLPQPPRPEVYRKYFKDLSIPPVNVDEWSKKKDRVMEKLQRQMEQLQQRMEALEKQHRDTVEKLLRQEDRDSRENHDTDDHSDSETEGKPTV